MTVYFAYGANLNQRVLDRRGLIPSRTERARLRGYRLEFSDVGVPLVEPAFATLDTDPDGEVHGVAYSLDEASLEALDAYEGKDNERLEVELALESGAVVMGHTYRSRVRRSGLRPSRRYLGLIVDGAMQNGLDPEWIARLRRQPSAYVPILSELIGASVGAFDWLNRKTGFIDKIFH